jgi:hypothetical protein
MHVQLAQLSAGVNALGAISATYGQLAPGGDASALVVPAYRALAPAVFEAVPATSAADDGVGVALSLPATEAGPAEQLAFSLSSITRESDPSQLPSSYLQGRNSYLFAVIGDPSSAAAQMSLPDGAANPAYDGHGLHVIALRATQTDAGAIPSQ